MATRTGALLGRHPGTQLATASSLVILAGLAWAWTVAMAAMPACHTVGVVPFLVMWTVMMAAMMFPAVIPVVLAYEGLIRVRGGRPVVAATLFVAGYLAVWGLLGLPARALLDAADRLGPALPSIPKAGGLVLVGCGLFQLTPFKHACLRHCRAPHLFLAHHWRDGALGAFGIGAQHGLFCAGCCASLMIVLLVVGVMNVAWMVALSALIYLEKVVPGGIALGRLAGVALSVAGIVRLVT